jgi:hypothetical protein
MANIKVKLTLLTTGGSSGPLYNAYYTTDGTTYIIAVDGSNVTLASVGSEVIITIPDNSTNVKLVNLAAGCQDNYYVVPVVTTTTTTTLTPLSGNGTYTCASPCGSNGTFTIQNLSGGIGPPYQTAFFATGDTPVWNNYPQVSAYGNLFVGCPVPLTYTFGVRTSNGYTVYLDSTLCTTTTQTPSTVTITTLNNLDTNSFTVYINGTADTGWKSGSRTYASGTVIKVVYNSNACGVTKNGSAYASNTNVTLSGGVAQSFSLNNYNSWSDTGYYPCQGNVQYKEQVNPCGQYQTVPRYYPPSTCDCACNQGCSGTSYGPNECRGQDLVQYEYYNCSGNPTGNYQVVQSCSCNCNNNTGCGATYYSTDYCGAADRYGKNPSKKYRDLFYVCYNAYITTETVSECSCDCNQTCLGEYWGDPYCDGTGIQKRNKKYTCNNANTGEVQTLSTCSATCGANLAPVWNNYGDPRCDGCNLIQDQIQINQCCQTPAYGTLREPPVDLGPNTQCGYWNLEYYCVGYDKWSRLRNTCTNTTCCDELVEVNSSYCGYSVCRTYEIIAYNADEYVSGIYTNCAGFSDSFSFYGGPGPVGSVCAQPSSVYVTSGNGGTSDVGGC